MLLTFVFAESFKCIHLKTNLIHKINLLFTWLGTDNLLRARVNLCQEPYGRWDKNLFLINYSWKGFFRMHDLL